MKTKHTPGPWVAAPYIAGDPDGFAVGLSITEDGEASGCSNDGESYMLLTAHKLSLETARLIAAAPDLLEALEAQEEAESYIIKNHEDLNPFFEATYREMLNYARQLRASAIAKATGGDAR